MTLKYDKIDDIGYVDEIDHMDVSKNMTLWSKFKQYDEGNSHMDECGTHGWKFIN
jgi:hypothetical protein